MELDKETKKYLEINTSDGLKQFNCMPYGILSGPTIFQRKIGTELRDIPITVVNIDDILITGKNEEKHLHNLHKECKKLSELGVSENDANY